MSVEIKSNQITGITTSIDPTDAASKQYADDHVSSGAPPPTNTDENKFLFTDGNSPSWQPIQDFKEYGTPGISTFTIPVQAKKFIIEATGAGGGGASGNLIASNYIQATRWIMRTAGAIQSINAASYKDSSYSLGGIATLWTSRNSPVTVSMNDSVYISAYLLGGNSGMLYSSVDSITWTLRTASAESKGNINAVKSHAGNYVAAGAANTRMWIMRTTANTSTLSTLIYDGTNYIIAGGQGVIQSSTNGIHWILRTSGQTTNSIGGAGTGGNGLLYASGQTEPYVYSGSGGVLATSTNSIQWVLRTASTESFATISSIAFGSLPTATYVRSSFTIGDIATSTDAINWTLRTTGNTSNNINTLLYSTATSEYYVNCGDNGRLQTSTDAIHWTSRICGSASLYGIFYGNLYIVGGFGVLNTSTNAIHWTLRTVPTSQVPSNFAYTSGSYAASGGGGISLYSTDAIVWLLRTSGTTQNISTSIFVDGIFIHAGQSGYIAYSSPSLLSSSGRGAYFSTSTDTISWTLRTTNSNIESINSLVVGSSNNLVAGFSDYNGFVRDIIFSSDGITWELRTSGFGNTTINTLMYDGTNYFAAGNSGRISTSSDSLHWVLRTSGRTTALRSLVYVSDQTEKYIFAGDSSVLSTSTNAIEWTLRTSGFGSSNINSVIYNSGLYISAGAGGHIRTSTNGVVWIARSSVTTNILRTLSLGNNIYVYGGDSGSAGTSTQSILSRSGGNGAYFATSTDTITWQLRTTNAAIQVIDSLIASSSFYVAGCTDIDGNTGIISASSDGINWELRTSGFGNTTINTLMYDGTNYFAAGNDGRISASTNTIEWSLRTSGETTNQIRGLFYTSSVTEKYVNVRAGGVLQSSTNGIEWSLRTSSIAQNLNAVVYGNVYTIVGTSGLVLTSTNAIQWTLRTSGTSTAFFGLSFGNSTYLASGSSGIVFSSTDAITWFARTSNTSQNFVNANQFANNAFLVAGAVGSLTVSTPATGAGGAGGGGGATGVWEIDRSQITGSTLTINVGSGGTSNTAGAGTTISWTGPAGTYSVTANGGSPGLAYTGGAGGTVNPNTNYLRAFPGTAGANVFLNSSGSALSGTNATFSYQASGGSSGANAVAGSSSNIFSNNSGNIILLGNSVSNSAINDLKGVDAISNVNYFYGHGGTGGGATYFNLGIWAQRTAVPFNITIFTLMYDGSEYFMGGSSGDLRTSTNGIQWSARTSGIANDRIGYDNGGNGLLYASGQTEPYVYSGQSGILGTSTNRIQWTLRTSATTSNISSIVFGSLPTATYVRSTISSGDIATSTNAIQWTLRTTGDTTNVINALLYSTATSEYYANVRASGILQTSTDAIHWTLRTSGITTNLNTIIYGDKYVIAGFDGVLSTSTNAIEWTLRTSGIWTNVPNFLRENILTLSYSSGFYVVAGANGRLNVSTDAITWQIRTSGFATGSGNFIYASTFGNNVFAVGGVTNAGVTGLLTTSILNQYAGDGGRGIKGGGGGGGAYEFGTNSFGAGGKGGDGYVRISWV